MTLRARLVLALGALLVVGLAIFGVAITSTYATAQYRALDDQLSASVSFLRRDLDEAAGGGPSRAPNDGPGDGDHRDGRPGDGPVVVAGTYGELRAADGRVLTSVQTSGSTAQPAVPDRLPARDHVITVPSASGSGHWRLVVVDALRQDGSVIVAAVPTSDVASSLRRLVAIESAASIGLLAILTSGAWLILRRGLRPLETMAASARQISDGDLSHRVADDDPRSEVGQLGLAINTMLDEIEAAFRERDATEAKLRRFLADASHELRTPLTSIQGFAELFRLGRDHPDLDLAVIMRRIEQESARMRVLVDDLLALARMDQTRPIERRPVDLAVLAADACTDATATEGDRAITLDAPEALVVQGDEAHLRQAIANLMTNALRHTPVGTPIEVAVRRVGEEAHVVVADRGPGLPPDAIAKVFDRFWQADASRTGTGVGLGLSIVAGVAQEHGGRAEAANRPDGGAAFTLVLPAAASPSPQAGAAAPPPRTEPVPT